MTVSSTGMTGVSGDGVKNRDDGGCQVTASSTGMTGVVVVIMPPTLTYLRFLKNPANTATASSPRHITIK